MPRILQRDELKLPSIFATLAFALAVFPLHEPMMIWVWVLYSCASIICIARAIMPIPNLNNRTLNLFAIFCLGLLIVFAGQYGLLSTMVNLLVVACSLKLLMMRTSADLHLVLIVLVFLIASGFIFHQGLGFAIYYSLTVFLVFYIAFLLNKGILTASQTARNTLVQLLQALPIAILIFVVTPRLPPFWQTPIEKSDETGLSEKITPGDIANLAKSTELVFRAEFTGNMPEPYQRYWRAIVLDYFDGQSWSIARETTVLDSVSKMEYTGDFWRYLVIAEPNKTRWLYALDIPQISEIMSSQSINMTANYQLFTQKPAADSSLYIVNSYYQMPLNQHEERLNLANYLQLPDREFNPQTQAFVESLSLEGLNVLEIINLLTSKFAEQNFSYTLKPPLMQNNPIDQFLFDYKRGFCSHYASALTYMLRLSGIPARIVTGYQGGTEQAGSILTVRQLDAHAWVEAWDERVGWIRTDPTAIVAPDRMTAGLLSALSDEDSELVEGNSFMRSLVSLPGFSQINDWIVLANHNWNQVVLGYDEGSQRDLIQDIFGEMSAKNLVNFLLMSFALVILFVFIMFAPWRNWLKPAKVEPEKILFDVLKKRGFTKQKSETLQTFVSRIKHNFDANEQIALHKFVEAFYQHHYQTDSLPEMLREDSLNKGLERALAYCLKNISTKKSPE